MKNLFLAEILTDDGGQLGKEESHHAARVLRLNVGDTLLVTTGHGKIYEAKITSLTKTEVRFKNEAVHKQEPLSSHLHIAIAPTKSNDRFEFFIEKAAELGVNEITPLVCDHSERKIYKTERGKKIINSASKQSLSCWWPQLNEPIKFSEFIKNASSWDGQKLMAYCGDGNKTNILGELHSYQQIIILIGPEGDFSKQEVQLALKNHFRLVSLGSKRLRTETAGIAVAMAHSIVGPTPQ